MSSSDSSWAVDTGMKILHSEVTWPDSTQGSEALWESPVWALAPYNRAPFSDRSILQTSEKSNVLRTASSQCSES